MAYVTLVQFRCKTLVMLGHVEENIRSVGWGLDTDTHTHLALFAVWLRFRH